MGLHLMGMSGVFLLWGVERNVFGTCYTRVTSKPALSSSFFFFILRIALRCFGSRQESGHCSSVFSSWSLRAAVELNQMTATARFCLLPSFAYRWNLLLQSGFCCAYQWAWLHPLLSMAESEFIAFAATCPEFRYCHPREKRDGETVSFKLLFPCYRMNLCMTRFRVNLNTLFFYFFFF